MLVRTHTFTVLFFTAIGLNLVALNAIMPDIQTECVYGNDYASEIAAELAMGNKPDNLSLNNLPRLKKMISSLTQKLAIQVPTLKFEPDFDFFAASKNTIFVGISPKSMLFNKQFSNQDIESIIAHELGHIKCQHVPSCKKISSHLSWLTTAGIWLSLAFSPLAYKHLVSNSLTWWDCIWPACLMMQPDFIKQGIDHISNLCTQPLTALISQQCEFEADAIGAQATSSHSAVHTIQRARTYLHETVYKPTLQIAQQSWSNGQDLSSVEQDKLLSLEHYISEHQSRDLAAQSLSFSAQLQWKFKKLYYFLYLGHPAIKDRIKALEEKTYKLMPFIVKKVACSSMSLFKRLKSSVKTYTNI